MQDQGHFEDLVEQLEQIALAMDRTGDSSHVHLLFRVAHNLKSSVAQVGRVALSTEVHQLEDALDRIRRGRETWAPQHYDLVMHVIDEVRLMLKQPEGSDQAPEPRSPGVPAPAVPLPSPWGLPLSAEQAQAASAAAALGQGIYRIDKLFRKGLAREVFHGLPVMEDLREMGLLIAVHPEWQAYSEGPEEQVVRLLFASAKSEAELSEILFDPLLVLQAPKPPGKQTLQFLIIEDDPTVGGLLHYILQQQGDCVLCDSGHQGLTVFKECFEKGAPIDLVILDKYLPDLHGDAILKEIRDFEAKRGIRDADSHCVVLVNTASKDLEQMLQTLELEPDGYLIKPMKIDLILEKVATLRAQRILI